MTPWLLSPIRPYLQVVRPCHPCGSGRYKWGWTAGVAGASNAAVQLPASSGSALLVAGWRVSGGLNTACVTKISSTGHEKWTATFPDGAGKHGAFEMIDLATDGVLLASGGRERLLMAIHV